MLRLISILLSIYLIGSAHVQAQQDEILPPTLPWKGKSLSLIAKTTDPWITPTEKSDFVNTPSHEETITWLKKLSMESDLIDLVTIGRSANGREIVMVIASSDPSSVTSKTRPNVLVQAGIHAGEIDGKDAGMMLLRDIAFGKKRELIKDVNLLFVPILNVDGHERTSPYNRVNQRGPSNMGWRTNARNLNLNRDYMKIDSEEIRAIIGVMNRYTPSFYVDLHVTDGADYQYDITFGYTGYSQNIFNFLKSKVQPSLDKHLKDNGHIPGPLIFATNDRDFSQGNSDFAFSPRFSNNYGELRRIPSILVENHSLKPFKQRVLGTYIFLEGLLSTLSKENTLLKQSVKTDTDLRSNNVVIAWTQNDKPDSMTLQGIESTIEKSQVTSGDYVRWTGKPVVQKIAYFRSAKPAERIIRPKAYWVPAMYPEVINRLAIHGIEMERITAAKETELSFYRIKDYRFAKEPFEGHFAVSASVQEEKHVEKFYPGSVRVTTDQPLGDLVIHLLEPRSSDSFFSWGFFPEIFTQTEYIEEYAIEPLARTMLSKDENLRKEFELKKQQDPEFVKNKSAVYAWFYNRSPFVDSRYLLYPVGVER